MDSKQDKVLLELCRDRVGSQESSNRQCSTKATSVITLSVGLMVSGGYWLGWDSRAVGWLGPFVLLVALPAVLMVVRPGRWLLACDLLKAAEGTTEIDDNYVFNLAVAHIDATVENEKSLRRKASCLTFCTYAVAIEGLRLVGFKIFPNIL